MRLYRFQTDTYPYTYLPNYNASTQPVNRSVNVQVQRSANGFVLNRNTGYVRNPERIRHTGSYMFQSPFNTESAAYSRAKLLESLVGVEGVLWRGYSDYKVPIETTVDLQGTQVDVGAEQSEGINALLESVVHEKNTSQIHSASAYEMRVTFTFLLLQDEWGNPTL